MGLWAFIKGDSTPTKDWAGLGHNYSFDWCRFRKNSHCFYPCKINEGASAQVGYSVFIPMDRGYCPRVKWEDQKSCPAPSQPGPNVPGGYTDATMAWEDGGQRNGLPPHRNQVPASSRGSEVARAQHSLPDGRHGKKARTAPVKKALASKRKKPTASGLPAALADLARMHKSGQLSDEEFSAAKAKILATPNPQVPGPGE